MSTNNETFVGNGSHSIEETASMSIVPAQTPEFDDESLKKRSEHLAGMISIGGKGSHMQLAAVNNPIFAQVDMMAINTDAKDLSNVEEGATRVKLFALDDSAYPAGAGGEPEKAQNEFQKKEDLIRAELTTWKENGMKVLFITAGLGGGTGSGVVEPLLKLCNDLRFELIVVLVTLPSMRYEGTRQIAIAKEKLKNITSLCDGIIPVFTGRVYVKENEDEGEFMLFDNIHKFIVDSVAIFMEVVFEKAKGGHNIDLNDILYFIKRDPLNLNSNDNGGEVSLEKGDDSQKPIQRKGKFFYILRGIGKGEGRMKQAIDDALNVPYLLKGASVVGATSLLWYTLTKKEKGRMPKETAYIKKRMLGETKCNLEDFDTFPGGSYPEKVYWRPEEYQDDALFLVMLVSNFPFSPLEAYEADLKWEIENMKKELQQGEQQKDQGKKTEKSTVIDLSTLMPDIPKKEEVMANAALKTHIEKTPNRYTRKKAVSENETSSLFEDFFTDKKREQEREEDDRRDN